MTTPGRDRWTVVLALFALGNAATGLWMLASPAGWYHGLPGRVPDFGPLNEHFVRDLGSMFVMMGLGLAFAAVRPAARVPVLGMVSAWYVIHAVVHAYDTLRGYVGPEHWVQDLPLVYGTAILTLVVTVLIARRRVPT